MIIGCKGEDPVGDIIWIIGLLLERLCDENTREYKGGDEVCNCGNARG